MSVKLSLSMRILLVLNPSIMSIMTRGSSCGCFTLLTSSSKNRMSLFVLLYFRGGILWMLITCLCCDFLRDLKNPLVDGPPVIVFISPITLCRWLNVVLIPWNSFVLILVITFGSAGAPFLHKLL